MITTQNIGNGTFRFTDQIDNFQTVIDYNLAIRYRILETRIDRYQKRIQNYLDTIPSTVSQYIYFKHFRPTAHLNQHFKITLKNDLNKHRLQNKIFRDTTYFLWAYYQEILIQFLLNHRKELPSDDLQVMRPYIQTTQTNTYPFYTVNQNDTGQILPLTNQYLDDVQTFNTPNHISIENINGQNYCVICLDPNNQIVSKIINTKIIQFETKLKKLRNPHFSENPNVFQLDDLLKGYEYTYLPNVLVYLEVEDPNTGDIIEVEQEIEVEHEAENGLATQKIDSAYRMFARILARRFKLHEDYILSTYTLTHFWKPHKFLIP